MTNTQLCASAETFPLKNVTKNSPPPYVLEEWVKFRVYVGLSKASIKSLVPWHLRVVGVGEFLVPRYPLARVRRRRRFLHPELVLRRTIQGVLGLRIVVVRGEETVDVDFLVTDGLHVRVDGDGGVLLGIGVLTGVTYLTGCLCL